MEEIVVLSGKGGTGKTSIVASFAALAQSKVLADCDVDAADLHLLLKPKVKEEKEFWSGHVRNCAALGLLVISKLTPFPVKDVVSATRFALLMPSL